MRQQISKLAMCKGCGFVACVCDFSKRHADDCPRKRAVLVLDGGPVTACKPHGQYACVECFPCDCGGDDASGS